MHALMEGVQHNVENGAAVTLESLCTHVVCTHTSCDYRIDHRQDTFVSVQALCEGESNNDLCSTLRA